jgi:hypothetical protein
VTSTRERAFLVRGKVLALIVIIVKHLGTLRASHSLQSIDIHNQGEVRGEGQLRHEETRHSAGPILRVASLSSLDAYSRAASDMEARTSGRRSKASSRRHHSFDGSPPRLPFSAFQPSQTSPTYQPRTAKTPPERPHVTERVKVTSAMETFLNDYASSSSLAQSLVC